MIYELFSQRRKRLEASGGTDVYQYTKVPEKLRNQMQQLLVDAIGPQYQPNPYGLGSPSHNPDAWQFILRTLCRELGVHRLGNGSIEIEQVFNYIGSSDTEGFLDVMELSLRYIERIVGQYDKYRRDGLGIKQLAEDAIDEVNFRFRGAKFGFQYSDGQFIRLDSEFSYEEVIKPALRLLSDQRFAGPQAEFLQAHSYYRQGDNSQAIIEAAKSFESTLKAICDINKWPYQRGARTSDLLKIIRAKRLWPDYLDTSFDQLLATLSSGLPRVRNEEGAHGQGSEIRAVPSYITAYALNLAAAKILFVTKAAGFE